MSCAAYGCTNRSSKKTPGITFHSFPKDEIRRQQWIIAVRRKDWMPKPHSTLCSKHFSEEMIDRTSTCCVRIRENAYPTIFDGFPPHLQQKLKSRKPSVQNIPSAIKKIKSRKSSVQDIPCTTEKIKLRKPSGQDIPSATKKIESRKLSEYVLLQDKLKLECDSQINDVSSPIQDLNQETFQTFQSSSGCSLPIIIEVMSIPDTNSPIQDLNHAVLPAFQSSGCSTNMVVEDNVTDNDSSEKDFYEWKLKNMKERCEIKRIKIKTLQQSVRRKESKIIALSSTLAEIKKKQFIDEDDFDALKKSSPLLAELLTRQLHRGEESRNKEEYSAHLQQFALNLHHYSRHAYNFVRKSFNDCLPHPRTITKWYKKVDSSFSYATEPFKCTTSTATIQPKSSLVVDEIANGEEPYFAEEECNSNASFMATDDDSHLAKDTLAFMDQNVNGEVSRYSHHRRQSI